MQRRPDASHTAEHPNAAPSLPLPSLIVPAGASPLVIPHLHDELFPQPRLASALLDSVSDQRVIWQLNQLASAKFDNRTLFESQFDSLELHRLLLSHQRARCNPRM
ncbi:hypothetical protein C8J57DRAFT_1513046 [Mycena rebaudengoi]|nr:hypothetical protein C8J57DRAFT_1513046 [Mycena rebaudengoi]